MFPWCLALATQPVHAEEEPTLHFDWPESLSASVTYEISGKRTSAEGKYSFDRKATHDLHTRVVDDDLWVTRTNRHTERDKNTPEGVSSFIYQLGDDLPNMVNTMVVDRAKGDCVGIQEGAEVRAEARTLAEARGVPQRLVTRVEATMGDISLRTVAIDHWSSVVGLWNGQPASDGRGTSIYSKSTLPGLISEVSMTLTTAVDAPAVKCHSQATERGCIRLVAVSKPDSVMLGIALRDHPTMDSYDYDRTWTLITEPRTLVPHRLDVKHSIKAGYKDGGTDTTEFTQTWTWDYASAAR